MKGDAKAAADRRNAREAAKAPLLAHAGVLPHVTPEEQERHLSEMAREQAERAARINAKNTHVADVMRATVAGAVSAEELAALDALLLRAYAHESPGMRADYWRDECKRRGLPTLDDPVWLSTMAMLREIEAEDERRRAEAPAQITLPIEVP